MTKLVVAKIDGIFCIIRSDGIAAPILLAARPVRAFLPGWSPRGACDSFAPWTILDLVHESGREASWLLTADMDHWPKSIAELDSAARAAITAQAAPAIRASWDCILAAAAPFAPPALEAFAGLNRSMIGEIVRLAAREAIGPTRIVDLRRDPQDMSATVRTRTGRSRQLRLKALAGTLSGNWQAAIQSGLVEGALTCPSPVDGKPVRSQDSLVLHEHRIAYRFVDPSHGLVFYVSTTHIVFETADLLIPAINTAFTLHSEDPPPDTLAETFLAHCIADCDALLAYLAGPAHRPAVICRGYPGLHIGHQLWNELSALHRLVCDTQSDLLPAVIIPNAEQGSEIFAPIEAIFPEFDGRVDRTLLHPQTLGAFVYASNYLLLRALDERITLDLAQRIRNAAERVPASAADTALAARIEAENTPCILFGLRVENRTARDPGQVIAESIEHLRHAIAARSGQSLPARLVVVIDGHNSRLHDDPVCLYESFGQALHEAPIFAELKLVLQLRRRFENTGVTIVNLCGASVARSLFWGWRAAFFVAFWGAGLAKYRWVCNLPGLVLSNRWNLECRGDLDIYHAPRYHEGGTRLRFIKPGYVTDLPEAAVMFAPINPVPHYSNFQLDLDGLRHELDAMIAEHLS